MKKRFLVPIAFISGSLAMLLLVTQVSFKEPGNKDITVSTDSSKRFEALEIPAVLNFAGEKVPLERWDVREAFDRELTLNYFATGNLSYILKLSKKWFPLIEERLKLNGVPDDFKYLCVAESNLQNLISKAGAVGYWQFMSYTSPGFGLEVNAYVDQRYDILRSTDAACEYFKKAYNKFGNWTAAAASYNCGMGGYNAAATYQHSYIYYDIYLPEETNKYIYRILTFKHLLSNPDKLEYDLADIVDYEIIPKRKLTVTSTIANLSEFAENNGSNYKILKLLNPWLRSKSLPVRKGNSYTILLP